MTKDEERGFKFDRNIHCECDVCGSIHDKGGYQAASEGRWVPIRSTDDLPKESGEYIVCKKRGDGSPGEVTIRYINGDEEMTRRAAAQYYLAYMPIPAYKED